MKTTDFAFLLSAYFTTYLSTARNVSPNTIESYRMTFKLLLIYCQETKGLPVHKISLADVSHTLIREYLDWLETIRKNSITTRNQRLAAIHGFVRYIQIEEPAHMLQCQKILLIPYKKHTQPVTHYLTPQMMRHVLSLPDTKSPAGRRDLTVLSLLYDSAARASELCTLRVRDIRLSPPAVVTLTGKGRKTRNVPLMANTISLLHGYLKEQQLDPRQKPDHPLFFNQHHGALTRIGLAYIVHQYTDLAGTASCPMPDAIGPHTFRHTKAMHLYQSGIDLIYIRDILGHADLKTTQMYAQIDTEIKRNALEKVYPELVPHDLPDWNRDNDLLSRLLKL